MNAVVSPDVAMIPCDSNQIAAFGYHPDSPTLRIKFKGAGASSYDYFEVPASVFQDMTKAESKGKFFGAEIRGKYAYSKLPDQPGGIVFGLSQAQEPKYTTASASGRIVNRSTGKPIPDDEPVMVFRAQDRNAVPMLWAYYDACQIPDHKAVIKSRIADFERFAKEHPERMKEPDSSLHDLASASLTGTEFKPVAA